MNTRLPKTIAATIHSIAGWQTAYMNQYLHNLDINNDQANVIQFVADNQGTNQRAVADLLSRNMASVTNLLKSLEQKGLIERRYEADDVRTKHVYLTTAGQDVKQQINQGFGELNQKIDLAMADLDQATFLNDLLQLNATLKK